MEHQQLTAPVCVISARPYGQRAVLKFAAHTGAVAIAGRFTPGNFTNYITRSFKEPRLIIVTDPRTDAQAIKEASYVNIPVIVCQILSTSHEYRTNRARPSATVTRPPSTSTLPSPPTTRVATPSVSSGGCSPVRSSACAAPSLPARPSGTS